MERVGGYVAEVDGGHVGLHAGGGDDIFELGEEELRFVFPFAASGGKFLCERIKSCILDLL